MTRATYTLFPSISEGLTPEGTPDPDYRLTEDALKELPWNEFQRLATHFPDVKPAARDKMTEQLVGRPVPSVQMRKMLEE